MKKRIKSIIAASLSLVLVFSMTGCGSKERMEAEINPDTPVEDVAVSSERKSRIIIYHQCSCNIYTGAEQANNLQTVGKTDECTY